MKQTPRSMQVVGLQNLSLELQFGLHNLVYMSKQLIEMNDKLNYMLKEIRMTGNRGCVGKNDTNVQMILYEKVIVPTLTYNLETVTNT